MPFNIKHPAHRKKQIIIVRNLLKTEALTAFTRQKRVEIFTIRQNYSLFVLYEFQCAEPLVFLHFLYIVCISRVYIIGVDYCVIETWFSTFSTHFSTVKTRKLLDFRCFAFQ